MKKMTNAELMNMPGGPLLESAKSQKQFIIKKQQQKGKQRGKSKGVTLMKAYFPNLVAKKDVSLASPNNANAPMNGQQRDSIGPQSNSAKDNNRKKLARHSNSMHAGHLSTSHGQQFVDQNTLHESQMALQHADLTNQNQFYKGDMSNSLIIIDDQPRNAAGLSQE